MAKYLSIDTEATGFEEGTYLIQLALVPLDTETGTIEMSLGREVLIACPSFEELKPKLNEWVIEHNEGLIRAANESGLSPEAFKEWVVHYLLQPEVVAYFGDKKPILLGKSLSALDLPLLDRYLGKTFMQKYFDHHTLDVTCVGRFLVDMGKLPEGGASSTNMVKHLGLKNEVAHTALSDAVDMAQVYLKLIQMHRV